MQAQSSAGPSVQHSAAFRGYACTLSTRLFLIPSKVKALMDYYGISAKKMYSKCVLPYESTIFPLRCVLLWHVLAAGAAPLPKTSNGFLFIKTLTTCFCDITPSSRLPPRLPIPPSSPSRPSSFDTFNTSPCTHAPLWTACSCRCLPRKPRGRKSRFYRRLDCRCLQWGEPL